MQFETHETNPTWLSLRYAGPDKTWSTSDDVSSGWITERPTNRWIATGDFAGLEAYITNGGKSLVVIFPLHLIENPTNSLDVGFMAARNTSSSYDILGNNPYDNGNLGWITIDPTTAGSAQKNDATEALSYANQDIDWAKVEIVPMYACQGFDPPVHDGAVKVKKNRCVPFMAELVTQEGVAMVDEDITANPTIEVIRNPGTVDADDVTYEALPVGLGTDGNEFEFAGGKWQYNLQTKNYTSSGTYSVKMVTGNDSEYIISPSCTGEFVIEKGYIID